MDGLVTATLLASDTTVRAGQGLLLALQLQIAPGWYVYWDNPGDSGIPTRVELRAPDLELGRVGWPAPTEIPAAGGILNLGHKEQLTLLIPATVKAGPRGPLELRGEARWLVCRADQCVPGQAALSLDLEREPGKPRGKKGAAPPTAIAEALLALPPEVEASFKDGELRARIPASGPLRLYPGFALLDLLPIGSPLPVRSAAVQGGTELRLSLSGTPGDEAFAVAVVTTAEGPRAFTLVMEPPR